MSFKTWITSAYKTVANTNVVRLWLGSWKIVGRMRVWVVDTASGMEGWKDFYVKDDAPVSPSPPVVIVPPPDPVTLNVTIAPSPAHATKPSDFEPNTVNRTVTASVSNGTGPYTYSWSLLSWSGSPPPAIQNPAAPTTNIAQQMNFGTQTAQARCIVQDSLGNTGSANVNLQYTLTQREWFDSGTL